MKCPTCLFRACIIIPVSNYIIVHYYFHKPTVSFTTQKEYKWAIVQRLLLSPVSTSKKPPPSYKYLPFWAKHKISTRTKWQTTTTISSRKSASPQVLYSSFHCCISQLLSRAKSRWFSARHYIRGTPPRFWETTQFSLATALLNHWTWSAETAGPVEGTRAQGKGPGSRAGISFSRLSASCSSNAEFRQQTPGLPLKVFGPENCSPLSRQTRSRDMGSTE